LRVFECPNGGHHAVIFDLLAFCPWCGPDKTPPRVVFDDSLAAQRRLLAVVEDLPAEARESIEAAGGTTTLTDRALTGTIAASQNLAKQLHAQAGEPAAKGNPWQNVDRLQRRWIDDFGKDPLDALSDATVRTLRLAFARRHVIEHNGGVVDEKYVTETGEGTLNRRLRIKPAFVEQAMDAAVALADGLDATVRL